MASRHAPAAAAGACGSAARSTKQRPALSATKPRSISYPQPPTAGRAKTRMIELADVHLTLASTAGPVHILRGVDLDVAAGTSVSVVGPSGSGKSSLLAIMGGIERATSGRVIV